MRKLFTFFSVLLATTALWAYDFQLEEYQHGTPPTNGCDSVETLRLTNIPPEEYTPTEEDCKIYYTSPNNYAVMPNDMNAFGANIISNICKNKQGVITFDQPVKYIGDKAFYRNSYLTSITLPNSVISIGTDAFWHCENLNSISFSQNLTHINYGAFRYCENLNSISLPENLTHIGESAFRYCTSLSSISISKKLESIGEDAFWDCDSLCDIVVDADNLYFDSRNNCNAIIETATNTLILGGRNTSIPTSVTSIGYYAFQGRSSLTSIVIPSNVKTINIGAFYDCRNLTSIEMYEGVTTIGGSAFRDCSSLASIKIPSTVTSFGVAPFQQCTSLVSIVVDDNNKIYDSRDNCNAIVQTATNTLIVGCKNTTIPNSVTSIGSSAFSECSSLTSITIPNSVTSLEGSAFSECSSLTSITIPTSVTNIENFVFWRCSSLDSITLSDNLINIGKYAFSETPITSIKIPKDVQTIGEYAFKKCSDLNVIYCEAINPPSVENITDNYNITLCVPRESLSEYKTHSEWGKFANIICIGDEIIPPVTEIPLDTTLVQITICEGDYYEWNGEALTEAGEYILVDIGSDGRDSISILNLEISTLCNEETHQIHYTSTDGKIVNPRLPGMIKNTYENGEGLIILKKAVTSVTYCAFHECSTLVSITLPNTVTYIDSYAFYGCFSLQSINIPDSVSWIGEWAFGNCHSLASITIPGAVKIIEGSTFSNCRKLASLTIGEGVEEIHGYSFYNCTSLTEINIPNSVKFIDNNAFLECDAVASIFIGKNVMSIGEDSFSNCGSKTLTSIAVHDDNKVYDSRENCNALIESSTNTLVLGCKTTIIPDGVTSIGSRAFEYRTHIDSIVIPDCVTHIGEGAFGYCRYLYKVTLGSGIKTIENAFYSCSSLNTVYCYAMTPPNGTGNIKSTVALYVPCSSLEAYKSDSLWGKFTNIQCFETTPPSAPQDTTIYHPTEDATICEGETYIWMGMPYTEVGTYTYEEIVEDENYIYHYIHTLELQVIAPPEPDTIVVEAYDSYEWHGVVYTESGTYIYEEHCYQEILQLTIIDTPTPPEPEIPTEGIGVFSVGEGKAVTFSRGNLQYTQSTNTWSFAENQWDMIGTDNVTGDSVSFDPTYGDEKYGNALADKIDLFGWSTSTTNFGVSTSTDDNDYSGTFVNWGTNQIGADAPNTWRTLTHGEWEYLLFARPNADALCGVAQVNGVNGLVFLPDTWTCPEGISFRPSSGSNYGVDYYAAYQTFTADQWSKLEASGAVFLPATGGRDGSDVDGVQSRGYYWSATGYDFDGFVVHAECLYFGSDGAHMSLRSRYYGRSVRLVKDVNTTIFLPTLVAIICEGDIFTWDVNGQSYYQAGTYTYEEIVEDENYIYHYIHTLELQVRPSSIDTIVVEAYDSYEWHGMVYTESGVYFYEEYCYQEILELTIIDTPTPPEPEIPTEGIGVFSIGEGKTVTFSRGNLQYTQSTNTWSFAENQWEMIGTDNVTGGSVSSNLTYGDSKSGNALADKIDLFGWSTSATNFGVSTSKSTIDYSGSFVDWGTNQIGTDAPNTWRTLTGDEWYYLRYTRTNADALCGVAQVNGVNGLVFLPDNWTCPEGATFKLGFHSDDSKEAYGQYQTFTSEQWSKLEAAGAVFLSASGTRSGSTVNSVQRSGHYWSANEYNGDYARCLYFYSDEAGWGGFYRDAGRSVRLVKDISNTTPEPPTQPQDTTIYHPTEYATICEGDEYYWMGMQFTEAGRYEVVEIVEEEDYIYHNIYTLELTVLPSETVVLVEEAYDSFEWHGIVYTESGSYFYEEWCYQEILELTIIPSTETAVDNMQTDSNHSAQKILRDQQILILRDGKTYTIMGQEI